MVQQPFEDYPIAGLTSTYTKIKVDKYLECHKILVKCILQNSQDKFQFSSCTSK